MGTGCTFVPWLVVEGGPFDIGMDLPTLMCGGGAWAPFCMAFGMLYAVGTMLTLVWKKAFLLQLTGLSLLLPVMGAVAVSYTSANGTVDALTALVSTLGPGAYLGWITTLLGIYFQSPTRTGMSALKRQRKRGRAVVAEARHPDRGRVEPRPRADQPQTTIMNLNPGGGTRTAYEEAMAQGEVAVERGDMALALRSFGHALGSSHDAHRRAECKVHIALVLLEMGELEEAHLFIQEAKGLDPESLRHGPDVGCMLPVRKIPRRGRKRTVVSPEP